MRRLTLLLSLLLLLQGSAARSPAQNSGASARPPSAAPEAATFISLDGRFTIALPSVVSAQKPLKAQTAVGQIEGQTFVWSTARGRFSVTYIDYPKQLADKAKPLLLDELREELVNIAGKSEGSFKGEREMSISGHAGRELRAEFPDETLLAWAFFEQGRLYKLSATMPNAEPQREAEVRRILDSFKLLSTEQLDAIRYRKIAEAEPPPLPQSPVAKKLTSDAADDGLKGKVKIVLMESESVYDLGPGHFKPWSAAYYNERGNLTKRVSSNYRGDLSRLIVYGYLDGQRASLSKSIRHEYDPPSPLPAPGSPAPRRDPRYTYKYKHKYDERGRLAETLFYGNDGKLQRRDAYTYTNDRKEWLIYNQDGSLHQKYSYTLDRDGNIVEELFFEGDMSKAKYTSRYTYEFDRHGNWTKRASLLLSMKGGQMDYALASTEYRTITYY
ncbi:MAG: hypothetical protein QOF02_205 [Blastocatellia bacterium]|nr:hypothetical protein [Blastocatellia bacterium]